MMKRKTIRRRTFLTFPIASSGLAIAACCRGSSSGGGGNAWPVAAQSSQSLQSPQPPALFGPVDGQLIYPPVSAIAAHTAVRDVTAVPAADYAIAATIHNPYAAITSGLFDRSFIPPNAYRQWSYGYDFRLSPSRGGAIYVDSRTFGWGAMIFMPDATAFATGGRRVLRMWRGGLPDLRIGADETNDLALVVSGPVGLFTVNGAEIAALDLSELPGPGDVAVAAGYTNDGAFGLVPGATMAYTGFTVAPAPPPTPFGQRAPSYIYGPVNGGIRQTKQGSNRGSLNETGEGFVTGARLRDGILNVRFINPYDADAQPWDYGFWFRSNSTPTSGPSGYYTLAIRSDRTYVLDYARAVSRAYIAREVQRGPVGVRTGAGEGNDVEVRVDGSDGLLSVNGNEIAALDLHDLTDEGEVSVLTAMTVPPQQGAVTRYENLTVAPLPPSPPQ